MPHGDRGPEAERGAGGVPDDAKGDPAVDTDCESGLRGGEIQPVLKGAQHQPQYKDGERRGGRKPRRVGIAYAKQAPEEHAEESVLKDEQKRGLGCVPRRGDGEE